jgi:hypothetical protein
MQPPHQESRDAFAGAQLVAAGERGGGVVTGEAKDEFGGGPSRRRPTATTFAGTGLEPPAA